MPKLEIAIAGAFSLLLLSSCGSKEAAVAENTAAAAESEAPTDSVSEDPEPGASNAVADPVPPPDAVSHPDGYLPPVPAEPDSPAANSSGPGAPPPATEDQYIRNGQ